ncbi:MAG: hypothetical protein MI919_05135, partial [Holophagales bacterium]|nr:hypothetical protein [Holophagales bacterium]
MSDAAPENRSNASAGAVGSDEMDIRWILDELNSDPPSIFFGKELDHPTEAEMHHLALLLPRYEFLAEPALFDEHLV